MKKNLLTGVFMFIATGVFAQALTLPENPESGKCYV
jgi:hypothetical protein